MANGRDRARQGDPAPTPSLRGAGTPANKQPPAERAGIVTIRSALGFIGAKAADCRGNRGPSGALGLGQGIVWEGNVRGGNLNVLSLWSIDDGR